MTFPADTTTTPGTHAVDPAKALVLDFIERVWNRHDPAAAAAFFHPAFHDHAYQPPGPAGHAGMVESFTAAFSDTRHAIEQITAEGDLVMLRARVTGRHTGVFRAVPPTGQCIEVTQYRSFLIREGRIAAHWALFDTTSLFAQLGAVPGPAAACRLP